MDTDASPPKSGKTRKKSSKTRRKGAKETTREPVKDHIYYQTIIAQLNRTLASLRSQKKNSDEQNYKLIAELATIEEDRVEVNSYLNQCLTKRRGELVEVVESMDYLRVLRNEYAKGAASKIKELLQRYDETQKELLNVIDFLDGSLRTRESEINQREESFGLFGSRRGTLHRGSKRLREVFYGAQQEAVVTRDALSKEIEMRLNQLAKDFKHSNETRTAAYSRTIIDENIALHRDLDQSQLQYMNLAERQVKQEERFRSAIETNVTVEQMVQQLQCAADEKDEIIDNLRKHTNLLRTLYLEVTRYHSLFSAAHQKRQAQRICNAKGSDLLNSIQVKRTNLGRENEALIHQISRQEAEVHEQHSYLEALHSAVDSALAFLAQLSREDHTSLAENEPTADSTNITFYERRNIMAKIIDLLTSSERSVDNVGPTNADGLPKPLSPSSDALISDREIKGTPTNSGAGAFSNRTLLYRTGNCGLMRLKSEMPLQQIYERPDVEAELWSTEFVWDPLYGMELGSYGRFSHSPQSSLSVAQCPCSKTCKCSYCWSSLFKNGPKNTSPTVSMNIFRSRDKITTDSVLEKCKTNVCRPRMIS